MDSIIADEIEPNSVYELGCMEIAGGISTKVQKMKCPGLDLWISTHPYKGEATGGDVHYISLCGGGITTRIFLGDVSGHGSHVKEFSEEIRKLVKRYINAKTQARFVAEINQKFNEYAQLSRFATAVVGTYIARNKTLELCIAGHPRPLFYNSLTGTWKYLGEGSKPAKTDIGVTNLPIGIDEDAEFDTFQFDLQSGDVIVFYTDSLTESKSETAGFLGEEGLIKVAEALSMNQQVSIIGNNLLQGVSDFRNSQPADDDESLILIHHNGQGAKKMSPGEKITVYAKFFGLKSY